ncbi:MAG: hypothetical protein KatS3mg111_0885 [Pirellulaceae bacterium]|nr:MAG: hypothetical protein KatS3mg111_0885 [Pirellulaceae bacterium]
MFCAIRRGLRCCGSLLGIGLLVGRWVLVVAPAHAELRVGAAKVDISPTQLPVIVNGSMRSHTADRIVTRLYARALVFDDGAERLGLVVVDSCMIPRALADEAKQLAAARTGLRPERICISATHTHSAPSSMGALGTDADPNYVPLLRQGIADALVAAQRHLRPAEIGWASVMAPQFTALRRWVLRPDRIAIDPFGNATVRANMHVARDPLNATGPTGPEDPELALIAIRSVDTQQPIAVLANYSMHYFQHTPISADYFGYFCDGVEQHLAALFAAQAQAGEKRDAEPVDSEEPELVAILSHGCSGDIWRRDYMRSAAEAEGTIEQYSSALVQIAVTALKEIDYQSAADLAMEERRLAMRYRVPDRQRLEWAQRIVEEMGERLPQSPPEIYAREQLYLHQWQATEVVVQAIRVGEIAIATTPTETYALTGLKIKRQSPLEKTMVIELANGGDGYIPPPEQHVLGGYNTWAARTAGLEVTAEPRIVAACLDLLESVCQKPRRLPQAELGPAAEAILERHPRAYWRLEEWSLGLARDGSGNGVAAHYEPGVVFYLDGADDAQYGKDENRCPHFAGGRLCAEFPQPPTDFTMEISIWNGMPVGSREVLGWFASSDFPYSTTSSGWHLGLDSQGRLLLKVGNAPPVHGTTPIPHWQWRRVRLERTAQRYRVFLGHAPTPEIEWVADSVPVHRQVATWFFGGRSDRADNWEGKLDEIVVW